MIVIIFKETGFHLDRLQSELDASQDFAEERAHILSDDMDMLSGVSIPSLRQ